MKKTNHDQQVLLSSVRNGNVLPDHTDNRQQLFNNSKTKFMKKTTVLSVVAMMIFGFLLTGCQQDDVLQDSNHSNQIIDFQPKMSQKDIDNILSQPVKVTDPEVIKELQFMRDEKMISDQFYEVLTRMPMPQKIGNSEVYPGCYESFCDAVNAREGIQQMMKEKELSGNIMGRHRRHTNMYSSSGGTIILRVKTAGSSGVPVDNQVPSDWITALNQAVTEWNALNYNVKFNVITAANNTEPNGYVHIYREALHGMLLEPARAQLPLSSGTHGKYVWVNSVYLGKSLTSSAKKFAMAHELGHIIGLLHTDTSEGTAVYNTISCYGSTNYTDPNSVFKSTIPYNQSWNGFTTCDKTVLNYYW